MFGGTSRHIQSLSFNAASNGPAFSGKFRRSMCVICCSPDYNGCATQCEQSNTMLSINLFTFVMPRDARSGDTVPVIVILHGSHVLQQSSIEALLNRTVGCTPINFGGQGTNYAAVTLQGLHPIYSAFLRMSSKLMGPDVDRNLYQMFDIEGKLENHCKQETISENKEKYVLWEFTAIFDHLLHTELVRIVNDRREVSTVYIDGLLNWKLVRNFIQS
jgi:hypothetical protein